MMKGDGGVKAPSEPRRTCAQCPRSLNRSRPWQRFCSVCCRNRWHAAERRQALAAYRCDERNGGRDELGHGPVAAHEEM